MKIVCDEGFLESCSYYFGGWIPYGCRPKQLFYKLKCWAWKRYSTIRSRYLPSTWCDRSVLLPHCMFEILSRFLEEECSPGHIEWYGEYAHKVIVNGEEKYVRDEMQELYDWWHKTYNKEYGEIEDVLWDEARKHYPIEYFVPDKDGFYSYDPKFATKEDEEIYNRNMNALNKLEAESEVKLEEMMHRLVNIRRYMWT